MQVRYIRHIADLGPARRGAIWARQGDVLAVATAEIGYYCMISRGYERTIEKRYTDAGVRLETARVGDGIMLWGHGFARVVWLDGSGYHERDISLQGWPTCVDGHLRVIGLGHRYLYYTLSCGELVEEDSDFFDIADYFKEKGYVSSHLVVKNGVYYVTAEGSMLVTKNRVDAGDVDESGGYIIMRSGKKFRVIRNLLATLAEIERCTF